ncbi:hypothetical protein BaRGS_00008598 [Batillaria attramentaria]|uniref:glutathione gamma-glutamylcysteinyltransferase n=1 Tax=Batillaria attramentaria TaxID=370345 RepID=A0ABD0LKI6_9CAEN
MATDAAACSKCHHKAIDAVSANTFASMATSQPTSPVKRTSLVTPSAAPIAEQFYRKPLPDTCIPFASNEGKKIFREALATEHMNCYFRLASQFRTQDEPAYCGLATLIMVLNALEIDPGRVWKGPWKWYHENMLDCCIPTELVRKHGITFDEFVCLANCNSLDTEFVRADDSTSEETFRELVKQITTKEDCFLIMSYSRPALGQTGDGHFAPVSGYHPERDLVLVLDTARFKYPPHWVALPLLFKSMQAVDRATGLPRGYIKVWPSQDSKALLLFKISDGFGINSSPVTLENYQNFLTTWMQFLARPTLSTDETQLDIIIAEALQGFLSFASTLSAENFVLTTQQHIQCTRACKVHCVIDELLRSLEQTPIFTAVCKEVEKLPGSEIHKLENIFGVWPGVSISNKAERLMTTPGEIRVPPCGQDACDLNQGMVLCHFIAIFLLSWPYGASFTDGTLSRALLKASQSVLNKTRCQYLKEESTTLRRQLKKLMGYHSPTILSPKLPPCAPK